MAEQELPDRPLPAVEQDDRHTVAVLGLELGIGVDVDRRAAGHGTVGQRPSGSSPRFLANSSLVTTSAAAPSLTPGALPAVVVPSGSKTGFSFASGMICAGTRSAVVLRMCDTPHSASERRLACRPSSPCESK
jgi:hypothetical protein